MSKLNNDIKIGVVFKKEDASGKTYEELVAEANARNLSRKTKVKTKNKEQAG